ncbi:MAG: hypothetical protein KDB27_34560 [Planctomycetales bacterium]|nr:hypothetical protein [Planctomycetales bacterium]
MINRFINQLLQVFDTGGPKEYLILAACAILLGFVCLKGFGSRNTY